MADSTPQGMSIGSPNAQSRNGSIDGTQSTPTPLEPARSLSLSNPSQLNPRSCVTCRRRKVRCDKRNPCLNCTKAGIECQFPGPGRAPRKTRKPPDTELLARLRRLEGVVQSLGASVDEEGAVPQSPPPQPIFKEPENKLPPTSQPSSYFFDADPKKPTTKTVSKDLGRLVIDEGRSRYVSNNTFWASLGEEVRKRIISRGQELTMLQVAEVRDILEDSTSDEEEFPSPDNSGSGSSTNTHHGFLFGWSSIANSLASFHPTPSQVFILWEVFKENVDPLLRVFHRPTTKQFIFSASNSPESVSKTTEATLFSIYYAALTSLTSSQCQALLGEDRDRSLSKYRFAMEQSLARANFLNSSSIMLLQAFVLFLLCVRRQDDTRVVWTLSGLAIRIAVSMGLHRDGESFGISPFEVEMRRRLWWIIMTLDTRAAEDHGSDYSIIEASYDTKLPLNINDEDISPDTKETPEEKQGCTEMTFSLIRFEVGVTMRRLVHVPASGPCNERASERTLEEKEKLIEMCHQRIEERYLRYCDMSVPIFWVTATVGRLIMAKMWLTVHHPLQQNKPTMSADIRDRLFVTSVEIIEFSRLLEVNESTAKWGWHFRTYMQWHAVAFVLAELCVRPLSPKVDRAWRAIDSVYDVWEKTLNNAKRGMLWRPLRKLMTRAQQSRERLVQEKEYLGWQVSNAPTTNINHMGTQNADLVMTENPINYPITVGVIGAAAEALGLDLTDGAGPQQDTTTGPPNIPLQPDITPAQRNLSDEDIDQWLGQGQMPAAQPDSHMMNWPNWDQVVRDFQTDMQRGDQQLPPVGEITDWF